jgi:hypothetical protein
MYKIKAGMLSIIFLLLFSGCENNTLSYETEVDNSNHKSLLRPDNKFNEQFPDRLAAKFIEKAQDRIDHVTKKANEKSDKVDITTVEELLFLANETLQDAKDAFESEDYELALELAKEAKEIADQAMEALEELVEEYESIEEEEEDEDGNNDSAELALKFIEQAQAKIDKATDKANNAPADVDVTDVLSKISEAVAKLSEAQGFYDGGNYADAIESAKAAKELASEALDMLEDLLEAVEEEEEYTDDNIVFELEYKIGETTSVEIESNVVLNDNILNQIDQVANLITNDAQDDVKVKLKFKLKNDELKLESFIEGTLTPEQEAILNQIENAIIDIFNSTNYEDFEVEIEIEFEVEEEEDDDD